jgi:diacylglycerol O-acyltransferase / wax synthase
MFPILPLAPGQAISIALTSYDGGVFFGVNGDRDAAPDAGSVAELIEESLAELVSAASADPVVSAGGEGARGSARRGTARRPPRERDPARPHPPTSGPSTTGPTTRRTDRS